MSIPPLDLTIGTPTNGTHRDALGPREPGGTRKS